jgi:TolB protein
MQKVSFIPFFVVLLGSMGLVHPATTQTDDELPTLIFESNLPHNHLCLIRVDGTNLHCFMESDEVYNHHPVWSPDGRFVAYHSIEKPVGIGASTNYIYDTENQTVKELPVAGQVYDWSANGMLLVLSPDAESDSEIYVLNPDISEMQQLTDNTVSDDAPNWSPDGRQIAYLSGFPEATLMSMSASGDNPQALTNGLQVNREDQPQWSPDGKSLAFVVNGDRIGIDLTSEIYTIKANGTHLRQLTRTGGVNLGPRWSPDGRQLVFYGYAVGAFDNMSDPTSLRTEIFHIDVEEADPVNLTQSVGLDYDPAWSPDGEWIAFASTRESPGIFIMRPDGSDLRMVTNQPPFNEGGREANNPIWRPFTQ